MTSPSAPIDISLVNGVNGDPSVYCLSRQTGQACLLDIGNIDALGHKDLLKVRHVLVSHTHIDHFIGFDRLLRINIPHGRLINLVGPTGLTRNIRGRLQGYSWNLLDEDQLQFHTHEIDSQGNVTSFRLSNSNNFEPTDLPVQEPGHSIRPLPEKPAAFVLNIFDNVRVEGICLDHGIDSVAYVLQSPTQFHVRADDLSRLGLTSGPWISELQTAILAGQFDKEIQTSNDQAFLAGELGAEIMDIAAPRLIGYVTDAAFSNDNLDRLKLLLQDVDTLICETSFLDRDFAKAVQKKHLTTTQAALIAAHVNADELVTFHYSNVYGSDTSALDTEAQRTFENIRKKGNDAVSSAIDAELNRA